MTLFRLVAAAFIALVVEHLIAWPISLVLHRFEVPGAPLPWVRFLRDELVLAFGRVVFLNWLTYVLAYLAVRRWLRVKPATVVLAHICAFSSWLILGTNLSSFIQEMAANPLQPPLSSSIVVTTGGAVVIGSVVLGRLRAFRRLLWRHGDADQQPWS